MDKESREALWNELIARLPDDGFRLKLVKDKAGPSKFDDQIKAELKKRGYSGQHNLPRS